MVMMKSNSSSFRGVVAVASVAILAVAGLTVLVWFAVSSREECTSIIYINKPEEALGLKCYDWPRPNGEGIVTDLANCNVASWCTCVEGVVTEIDENPQEQDLDCALDVFQMNGSIPYHPEDAPMYCIVDGSNDRLLSSLSEEGHLVVRS